MARHFLLWMCFFILQVSLSLQNDESISGDSSETIDIASLLPVSGDSNDEIDFASLLPVNNEEIIEETETVEDTVTDDQNGPEYEGIFSESVALRFTNRVKVNSF